MSLHPILLVYHGSPHITLIITIILLIIITIVVWVLVLLISFIKKTIRKIKKLPPKEKKVFRYKKHLHFIAWPLFSILALLYIYIQYTLDL